MFPNKVISVSDSILWKFTFILKHLQDKDIKVEDLWVAVSPHFEDINQFILCLDALFVLDKLEYDTNHEVLKLC
jgi:hypothetical protein